MVVEAPDPAAISKLISQQVEQVTCAECCKYFIAPETASCGHSLCHSCWKGRRTCYTCASTVNKKALKVNLPLQTRTEHIHALADAFEKLYNVTLEDFTLEILDELQSEDPTKNVKEWLASSENQFSAPVLKSQISDHNIDQKMELSKSKIQLHTYNKKSDSPTKVVHPPYPQDDWDKIEVLPDTEEVALNPKDLGIGPMDIEPFFVDDDEYTNENPRRSSRKKENKEDSNPATHDVSEDKNSVKNLSDTKSLRNKQNWSNVNKMRKEFSKLNKKNRSKLNVSIEMCKKTQAANKKKAATPPQTNSEKNIIDIDDNTPAINVLKDKESPSKNIVNSDDTTRVINISKQKRISKYAPLTDDSKIIESQIQIRNNSEIIDVGNNSNAINVDVIDKSLSNMSNKKISDDLCLDKQSNINLEEANQAEEHTSNLIKENKNKYKSQVCNADTSKKSVIDKPIVTPFLKNGSLCQKVSEVKGNDFCITQNEIESKRATTNSDDIEISIRIGSTVTNIVIKNKKNDVQMKVSTDQGIQTSLGPHGLVNRNDAANSPIQELNIQNVELNIQENNKVTIDKSFSTKKNTASAETVTATAQFEITDSIERELSDVMECLERKRIKTRNTQKSQLSKVLENAKVSQNFKSSQAKQTETNSKSSQAKQTETRTTSAVNKENINDNENAADMEDLNDEDIFNSGSVKENYPDVKLLKNAKYAASEILMPTLSKKSQKLVEKRDRETNDVEFPSSKRQKIVIEKMSDDKEEILPSKTQEKEVVEASDSAQMNYDIIMSQVFANIDADIESSNKHIGKPTQILGQKSYETGTDKHTQLQLSQIVHRTQSIPNCKSPTDKQDEKDIINQKDSENVFSMMDKESEHVENVLEKNNKKLPEVTSTQQHIDNLLTPGMCRDLVGTHVSNSLMDRDEEMAMIDPILGTPAVDNEDSDNVVEETPQKNVSFTKPKQNDVVKTTSNTRKRLSRKVSSEPETQDFDPKASDSQIIKSIINISDTTMKEVTVVDVPKKSTLETPSTINNFVNHIKHNSTPVARKSLNFDAENDDDEQTLCPTTTQEKEVIAEAFKPTPNSPIKKPLLHRNLLLNRNNRKYYVAGSCLNSVEVKNLKLLCQERGWIYLDKYSRELTHLVVGVDDENKSQRSVKYMCALAASKWIVSYAWVEKCLQMKYLVDEAPYEALDACGEPGPRRSRTALKKVFEGVTFYCMPPFSVLQVETLKQMLECAGGQVVNEPEGVRLRGEGSTRVLLLLAEPAHTQEDRFIYIAMEHGVVPVNYEWALNCLGTYTLCSIQDLLLCPSSLLPPATSKWPAVLLMREEDDE